MEERKEFLLSNNYIEKIQWIFKSGRNALIGEALSILNSSLRGQRSVKLRSNSIFCFIAYRPQSRKLEG